MDKLTDKQEAFCKEYLIDFNATQAAIRAGYSEKTAYNAGWQNVKKCEIQERLTELKNKRAERVEITQDRVLEELAYIAFFDIRKLFDDEGNLIPISKLDEQTARAIAAVDVSEQAATKDLNLNLTKGEIETASVRNYLKKIKALDKKAALELLGKHLGMFTDVIRIEDANSEFQAYLEALYNYLDEHGKAQYRAFATGQPSPQSSLEQHRSFN